MLRQTLRAHRALVVVLMLFVTLGIVYSTTTPLFEAPDEQWHFAFVQHVATGRGLPVQTEPLTHRARQEGSQPPLYYLLAAAATFWIDTSDFPGIVWENPHYGYNVPGIVNDNKNLFIHTSLESFPYRGATLAIHIARLLSVLMGALAVLFTYWLALEIFDRIVIASEAKQAPIRELEIASGKDRPRNDNWNKVLAASAAAVVAFVPQFLFISSAVSNDSTIVAMSAAALWQSVISGQRSAVSNQRPEILCHFVLFTFAFCLVAGWWYARNLVLYGELTGTARMSELFYVRATPMPLDQLLVQLREVWETFWIGFGWGNIRAQPIVYTIIEIFVAFAVLGWILKIRNSQFAIRDSQFAILFVWLALMFAALIYWMQSTQAPHGRLFFPALPALAVLLAVGLAQFQRSAVSGQRSAISTQRLRFTFHGLLLPFAFLLFTCSALAPFTILQPAYAYPPTLSERDAASIPNRVDISYDDRVQLLGYDVSSRRVAPGEALELTLYWRGLTVMDEDYSIGISVVDAQQRVIGTRNSYHGRGMLPTRLWFAGQAIRDAYWLPIDVNASAGIAQIQVSLYERISKRTLIARDPRGEIITPFIGQIEIVQR